MKKSKKFIKFKDYIIKLPNSMGLIGSKNPSGIMNNDLSSFVESSAAHGQSDVEGPGAGGGNGQNAQFANNESFYNSGYGQYGFNSMQPMHPNMRLRDKGYSIYVVDDEHEIHRFDIDSYEWSIISTTKD